MTPGIELAIRLYQERQGAELALQMAERDFALAHELLVDAKERLLQAKEWEQVVDKSLTDYERAEVLMNVITEKE